MWRGSRLDLAIQDERFQDRTMQYTKTVKQKNVEYLYDSVSALHLSREDPYSRTRIESSAHEAAAGRMRRGKEEGRSQPTFNIILLPLLLSPISHYAFYLCSDLLLSPIIKHIM